MAYPGKTLSKSSYSGCGQTQRLPGFQFCTSYAVALMLPKCFGAKLAHPVFDSGGGNGSGFRLKTYLRGKKWD
eukprot:1156745-Pelagomonas_calceolata.AAC.8